MKRYDPKQVEPKWQETWSQTGLYKVTEDESKPKAYVIDMFPYPSGAGLHVGHVRNFSISDTYALYLRQRGKHVLRTIGFDGFGLPTEQYAIKTGISPQQATSDNIKIFKDQLQRLGMSYDWSRELDTTDPGYYRWTQWVFLQLHKQGLAYQKENLQWWCEHDQTVLADEQVEGGKCWRCGNPVVKKALKQWFFKITDYADQLLDGLEEVDWPEKIKVMQRNWIGRSVGAELKFNLKGISGQADDKHVVSVFTTRPDTLGGATFLVVSPELAQTWLNVGWQATDEVRAYIQKSLVESDLERQDEAKPKTGADTGITTTNPLTGKTIPVWVADYVLGGYGTGAIMAVPAHDTRDFEFAQKFDLPITQVIQPISVDTINPPKEGAKPTTRNVTQNIIYNPKNDTYLTIKWKKHDWQVFVTGGIEDGEDMIEAAKREITEETGYKNLKLIGKLPFSINSHFYAAHKDVNRDITMNVLKFELETEETVPHQREDYEDFDVVWVKPEDLAKLQPVTELPFILKWLAEGDYVYTGEGRMINSKDYDGMNSAEARDKMTAKFGMEKVNYKMRDWLISRQRYWGAPIPIIHCPKCGAVPVPETDLPVELPPMESYQPSGDGRSALARATDWLKVDCPKCGGPAERETDTMDGYACSSWYFLRYADPHNNKQAFAKPKVDYWLPVDIYVGGDHAVAHLLYARFWNRFFFDQGLISHPEPFAGLRYNGYILAPDGSKMSKSKGNVVNPNDLIDQGYGADALRMYELFIGPYEQNVNWNPTGIDGTKRFLNRAWTLVQEYIEADSVSQDESGGLETALTSATHRTIQKVTYDLENFNFNTAIAALMELVNDMYKFKTELPLSHPVWKTNLEQLVLILAPFAPHLAEELWQQLGSENSVHISVWPDWDKQLVQQELVTIAIQVNGKLRGKIDVETGTSQNELVQQAKAVESVSRHLDGKLLVKEIVVHHKLVNFVVK